MVNENKAVFFDRDGTLNVDIHYCHLPEDFIWTPEARKAIKYCNDKGYKVIVITNQSGVARGYYSEKAILLLHKWMNTKLFEINAWLDGIYYCPHHIDGKVKGYNIHCDCRKPSPKMILKASDDFGINLKKSYFVGDSPLDMDCAKNAGVTGIKYNGGSLYELVKNNVD